MELARSHLEAPLEECDGSRNQAQEETEEVMSLVASWVSMLRSRPPPLELLEAPLVACRHLMMEILRAPHQCKLDVLGTLETQLSCHPATGSGSPKLWTLRWYPAALPQRSAHVDPHTASMRSNAHVWSNPQATFRWRVRFPYHDDVISSQNCLGSRSSTNRVFDAVTDRHLSMSFHGGLTNLTRLLKTCIRRCKITDRVRCVDVAEDGVQARTHAGEESSLNGWTVDSWQHYIP